MSYKTSEVVIPPSESAFEMQRRIGFAIAEIEEALGLLEDCEKNESRDWVFGSLVRARDWLRLLRIGAAE